MNPDDILLKTVMSTVDEAVLLIDTGGRIVRVNQAFEKITGWRAAEAIGQQAASVLTGRQAEKYRLVMNPINQNGINIGYAGVLRPREEDSDNQDRREGFDTLTGLPNRHLFRDRLEQALHQARRDRDKAVAIVLVGLDHFSRINEAMGEDTGDRLLQELTNRLGQCVRASDTVARLEGDRFAFAMHIASATDSVTVAEKVLQAFARPFTPPGGGEVAITCSIGVSIFPGDGDSADDLIKNAAVAMLHAKQAGRNRHQFYASEMNERARTRLELERGMRRALVDQEFLVYYQPKIEVDSGRVAGLEALVRWRDPEKGLIAPGQFIPVAEESGLIEQIGQWVLEETCRQIRQWQIEGLSRVKASVNVSARQFRHRDFVAAVEGVLSRTGLSPCWLELEITESMLIGNMDAMAAKMRELRSLGVSLSIDDFGTGYSSLSYLNRFPITTLKIDRAFITDIQNNPHTAEIARAIIGLSRGLNLEVVAEGAEVREQVDFLRANGCKLIQGFFYSRPLPAEEFAAMLRNKKQTV